MHGSSNQNTRNKSCVNYSPDPVDEARKEKKNLPVFVCKYLNQQKAAKELDIGKCFSGKVAGSSNNFSPKQNSPAFPLPCLLADDEGKRYRLCFRVNSELSRLESDRTPCDNTNANNNSNFQDSRSKGDWPVNSYEDKSLFSCLVMQRKERKTVNEADKLEQFHAPAMIFLFIANTKWSRSMQEVVNLGGKPRERTQNWNQMSGWMCSQPLTRS